MNESREPHYSLADGPITMRGTASERCPPPRSGTKAGSVPHTLRNGSVSSARQLESSEDDSLSKRGTSLLRGSGRVITERGLSTDTTVRPFVYMIPFDPWQVRDIGTF